MPKKKKKFAPSVFRYIGYGFIGVTLFLLLIVMYMALSRATIIIQPKEEMVNADLLITVKEKDLQSSDILGRIATTTVSREAVFTTSGVGSEMPAVAMGNVTIYNKNTKSQPLIKTTRFLSKGGVLFRLKKGVTVSAGKTIKAVSGYFSTVKL